MRRRSRAGGGPAKAQRRKMLRVIGHSTFDPRVVLEPLSERPHSCATRTARAFIAGRGELSTRETAPQRLLNQM